MKKMSLITATLLLAGNLIAQDSFESAIKAGTVSGDVVLYGASESREAGNDEEGFTSGSIGLGYETGSFNGFKAEVGFRANQDFSEQTDGFHDDTTKAILHTANISFANKYFEAKVGRQEIDLEWMGDFHEAIVASTTAIPDTTVVFGFTNRIAVADADDYLADFEKVNNDKGAYVLDAKYEGIEGLAVNPYYYNAPDLAKWYGLKLDYDTDVFGLTAHGAKSSEDVVGVENGQVLHFEARTEFSGLALNVGYITTDKDNGVGSIAELGDNISVLEDGNQVYEADAKTTYLGLGYEISGFELAALYGQTKYANEKEKELNLAVDYGISENLAVGALFVDVNAQDSASDYNRIALTLQYSF